MLKFYTGFEINDQTGNALTENEMTTIHYDRITSLQVIEIQKTGLWARSAALLLQHVWGQGSIPGTTKEEKENGKEG